MSPSSFITLTTDFQTREPFVACIKGLLCSRCPKSQIIDLSHDIDRQDVMEGALFLAQAVPSFPAGTIHLAAVSCGATPIIVTVCDQWILCPDNGLVTMLAKAHAIQAVHSLPIPERRGGEIIRFGQEIFAPAAAALVEGSRPEELGEAIEKATLINLPDPVHEKDGTVVGQVMHIDRFGNLVSNIHHSFIGDARVESVMVGDFPIQGVSQTYQDVPLRKPLAIFGASGYLEVAYNSDRADERLSIGKGIVFRATLAGG